MGYIDMDNSSEERIFQPNPSYPRGETKVTNGGSNADAYPGGITVTTQVDVSNARTNI